MAKVVEKEKEASVPAAVTASGPPAELAELMKEDTGKGLSKSAEDNLVPLIYILQALSPQVASRNSAYIEGAEPGSFWLRNAPNPIVSGEDGLLAQPCYFTKDWVEWKPRDSGGGFIARHADCPPDAVKQADPRDPNRVRFIRPNGNEVIETRNHVVRVFTKNGALPFIIPFSSTGHTTSRAWMQLMNSFGNAPSFARKYKLVTKEKSNAKGTWFAVEVTDAGWVTPEEYKAGTQIHDAFASGSKQAEAPVAAGGGGEEGDSPIPF